MHLTKHILTFFGACLLLWACQPATKESKAEGLVAANSPKNSTVEAINSFDQWLKTPEPLISAHRGGPYSGFPENAIENVSKHCG